MKKFIKIFLVICLIFNLNIFQTYGFDGQGTSGMVGVYHGELILDFSSAWDRPMLYYREIRNELNLDVSYNLRNTHKELTEEPTRMYACSHNDIIFNINNLSSTIGKRCIIASSGIGNINLWTPRIDTAFFDKEMLCKAGVWWHFDKDTNIKDFSRNDKVIVAITILDYLWEPDIRRVPVIPRPIPRPR